MVWDIMNTLLEFSTIYLLFLSFSNLKPINSHLYLYIPLALGLSVYFCLNIPHLLLFNVILLILCQYVSFTSVSSKERLRYAAMSVFLTLSFEILITTFLPLKIMNTYFGDTITNLIMITIVIIVYLRSRKNNIYVEIAAFILRRFSVLLIFFLVWCVLAQIYVLRLFNIWTYLPGALSLLFLFLFGIGMILDIRYIRSEEHRENILYENSLQTIRSYLEKIRIENHDYKHHIHYLQDRIRTSNDRQLQEEVDSYVAELDKSTELQDMILSVDSILFRSVIYGCYLRCQENRIPFSFSTTNLLPAFPVKDYQLVSALENLISNAIENNMTIPDDSKRFLQIDLKADSAENIISITNPVANYTGNIDDYFLAGYSSKDPTVHKGLGLTSVLQTMSDNDIAFSAKYSENDSTISFTIRYFQQKDDNK